MITKLNYVEKNISDEIEQKGFFIQVSDETSELCVDIYLPVNSPLLNNMVQTEEVKERPST